MTKSQSVVDGHTHPTNTLFWFELASVDGCIVREGISMCLKPAALPLATDLALTLKLVQGPAQVLDVPLKPRDLRFVPPIVRRVHHPV